jgi:hypothetical protein
VPAVLAPLHGAESVAGLFARASRRAVTLETTTVWLNGAAAGLIEVDGELAATSLVVEDGRIARIYVMRNPGKLTRLQERTALAR